MCKHVIYFTVIFKKNLFYCKCNIFHHNEYDTWTLTKWIIHRLKTTERSIEKYMVDRIRSDSKRITLKEVRAIFYIIDRIKRLKRKWVRHITKRQYMEYKHNTVYSRHVKRSRRIHQMKKSGKVRKVDDVNTGITTREKERENLR